MKTWQQTVRFLNGSFQNMEYCLFSLAADVSLRRSIVMIHNPYDATLHVFAEGFYRKDVVCVTLHGS